MKNTIGKTDLALKADILAEIDYEPCTSVTHIGVLVNGGAVTLNGSVSSYGEKAGALRAAKRVTGVNAIADDIEIKLPDSPKHSDGEIAEEASRQIRWSSSIQEGTIQVMVSRGWLTMEGEVEWRFQKDDAEKAVHHILGVTGVTNHIAIRPRVTAAQFETAIKSAFERNVLLNADKIQVVTLDNTVILRGEVRNFAELEEAERIAHAAPGVILVDNRLTIIHSWLG